MVLIDKKQKWLEVCETQKKRDPPKSGNSTKIRVKNQFGLISKPEFITF